MDIDNGPMPLSGAAVDRYADPTTFAAINERLKKGSERMDRLEASMKANTKATEAGASMIADVHEVIAFARSGLLAIAKFGRGLAMVGRWIRTAVIWLAPVVAAAVALWHALHGNATPKG